MAASRFGTASVSLRNHSIVAFDPKNKKLQIRKIASNPVKPPPRRNHEIHEVRENPDNKSVRFYSFSSNL